MNPMNFYIFAGEMSGDLHGGRLMRALKKSSPSIKFEGVGGPSMRIEGIKRVLDMEQFQVMGFTDVLKSFPRLYRQFHLVKKSIMNANPDAVILIDYPGFNLRMARILRKEGFKGKIVQYISPSVWAHGKNRIKTMSENLNLLLTIYPFEANYFSHTTLPVKYIGNPLVENISSHQIDRTWAKKVGIPNIDNIIGIFPGSRKSEIKNNLPFHLNAAKIFKDKNPSVLFAISLAHEDLSPTIQNVISNSKLILGEDIFLAPAKYRYDLMQCCQAAIAKSGTVTLELALYKIPTVVTYYLTAFNYLVAKYILKLNLPFYSIVNILAKKDVFPELIGKKLTVENLLQQLDIVYKNGNQSKYVQSECELIRENLGCNQTHQTAAGAILELFHVK